MIINASLFANSDLANAPKNFISGQNHYVFVDFIQAHYKILYQVDQKKAYAVSTITFIQPQDGMALFDFSAESQRKKTLRGTLHGENPIELKITSVKNPHYKTEYRSTNIHLPAGTYKISVQTEIEHLVKYEKRGGVSSSFWMSDLNDRSFLEKYLPSNLDYDRFQMFFDVKIAGTQTPHAIMTNCGQYLESNENWYRIKCPATFNSSSLYFHLFPKGKYVILKNSYKSITGKIIPILSYGHAAKTNLRNAPKILKELENDYGKWPYPHLIIFGWPPYSGGMEYAGATSTSTSALGHELHHSYFARGMFPAGGNAGWIDEALASWRDNGYPKKSRGLRSSRMGGHSIYRRDTDRNAYTLGADFIAYLDYKFAEQGGMKKFKKDLVSEYIYQPMTTPKFHKLLESYFKTDLRSLFDNYIYGVDRVNQMYLPIPKFIDNEHLKLRKENAYHRRLTEEQLMRLL